MQLSANLPGKIIYLHPHCSCLGSKHVINSNHGCHDFWLICFGFNSIFVNRVFLMNKTFSIQLMAAIYQVGKLNLYGSWYHLLNYTRTSFSLFLWLLFCPSQDHIFIKTGKLVRLQLANLGFCNLNGVRVGLSLFIITQHITTLYMKMGSGLIGYVWVSFGPGFGLSLGLTVRPVRIASLLIYDD